MGSAVRQLAAVVALALALPGCAGIPTSSSVEQGAEVLAGVDDPVIRVLPRPPAQGLSPAEVVRGFLAASTSFEDDHAVARLYLTPDAGASWDATTGVTVYDDEQGVVLRENGPAVRVRARAEARIDRDGLLSPTPSRPVDLGFVLTRSAGEWRIASLPDGLLLSGSDVARSFRPFDLYFLSPEGDRLVPDPVFIPIARPGAATSLVRALIDGPTPWLAPAVRSAFPTGTTTVVDAVPIENGVADVDLSAQALAADDEDRERMAAQLVWTLTQLSEVTAVTITVEGSPLQLPTAPVVQTTATWAAYDPNTDAGDSAGYLTSGGTMAEYVDGEPQPVPGVLGSGSYAVADPTATASGDLFAVLTDDRTTLLVQQRFAPDDVDAVLVGTDLAAPSFDHYGRLWLADRTTRGTTIRVRFEDGRLRRVLAPWLEGRRVAQLRIAPDGTRAAVVVDRADGTGRLFLARVVVADGSARIEGLRRLERQLVDVRDVAWQSADRVVALARQAGAVLQPFGVGVDGTLVQAGGSLNGIVGLTAAAGRPLLADTDDGRVWQDAGLGWRVLSRGSDPAYPG